MASNKLEYIDIKHDDPSNKTINDFVIDLSSIGYGFDIKELLAYEDENGVKNITKIFSTLEVANNLEYKNNKSLLDNFSSQTSESLKKLPLPLGTSLSIKRNATTMSFGITVSDNAVSSTDFKSFIADNLFDLLKDIRYEKKIVEKGSEYNTVREQYPFCSVWLWSKALSKDLDGTYKDNLLNLTPFVMSTNTNSSSNGGNFNISLSPALADYISEWRLSGGTLKGEFMNHVLTSNLYSTQNNKKGDRILKRNHILFDRIIQENDVIFIKFEKLLNEDNRDSTINQLDISTDNLPNQNYDMIGLVDRCTVSTSGTDNDIQINVEGRDLLKLFIEDNVCFYPLQFTDGGIFSNVDSVGATGEPIQITRFDGQIKSRFQSFGKTIPKAMQFIINALSTISITSDSLFDYYKDKRTKAYQVVDDERLKQNERIKVEEKKVQEIKEHIKKCLKIENLDDRDINIDSLYLAVFQFVNNIIENKVDNSTNNDLTGWKEFNYNFKPTQELLELNEITADFDSFLFKPKTAWRDQSGNIITNSKAKEIIAELEKQAQINRDSFYDKISQQPQDYYDQLLAEKEANKKLREEKMNFKDDMAKFNYNLRQDIANDINKSFVAESTDVNQGFAGLSDFEKDRYVTLELLDAKYNDLKKQIGQIFLVRVRKKFDDLNEEGKQAFKKVYRLIKERVEEKELDREFKEVKGIWQIIKLVTDESIANRRIVDPSIGNTNESLLNAIRKLCQEPFVQFLSDTYKDQYFLIARKAPFDRESVQSYIKSEPNTESNLLNDTKKDIVISIEENDIIDDTLAFSNEAYSWYRLQPLNLIGGDNSNMAFAYLKAVFFPEYAEIYGSKPLDVTTNYIDYLPILDKDAKLPTAYFIKQGIYDLKYLIESHSYLPFTREGSITIVGDRRIKKGTFVRLKSTGEIFYVNAVTQQFTVTNGVIERLTQLQVSRGMVEEYIHGQQVGKNREKISYFNIINTDIDETVFTNQDFNKLTTGSWKVNPLVFNFFINRLQFVDKAEVDKKVNNFLNSTTFFTRDQNNRLV